MDMDRPAWAPGATSCRAQLLPKQTAADHVVHISPGPDLGNKDDLAPDDPQDVRSLEGQSNRKSKTSQASGDELLD